MIKLFGLSALQIIFKYILPSSSINLNKYKLNLKYPISYLIYQIYSIYLNILELM